MEGTQIDSFQVGFLKLMYFDDRYQFGKGSSSIFVSQTWSFFSLISYTVNTVTVIYT